MPRPKGARYLEVDLAYEDAKLKPGAGKGAGAEAGKRSAGTAISAGEDAKVDHTNPSRWDGWSPADRCACSQLSPLLQW